MKILKVINNNVLSSVDNDGCEIIVTGCGIGFKKKAGDEIDSSVIEKTYKMKHKSSANKLQELIEDIPLNRVDACSELIDYYKTKLNGQLNETLVLTLTDHVNFAIERLHSGTLYTNPLLSEIRQYYPEEFTLGQYSVEYISEKLGEKLSEDEAGFIAMHIVNAELNTHMSDVFKITEFINSIVKLVETYYGKSFNKNSVYYDRFVVHLKFFARRLFSENAQPYTDGNADFQQTIKQSCPRAADCAEKIAQFVLNNYNIELGDEEKMYLTIHLKRIN